MGRLSEFFEKLRFGFLGLSGNFQNESKWLKRTKSQLFRGQTPPIESFWCEFFDGAFQIVPNPQNPPISGKTIKRKNGNIVKCKKTKN